jgi:hypothetical protein
LDVCFYKGYKSDAMGRAEGKQRLEGRTKGKKRAFILKEGFGGVRASWRKSLKATTTSQANASFFSVFVCAAGKKTALQYHTKQQQPALTLPRYRKLTMVVRESSLEESPGAAGSSRADGTRAAFGHWLSD